MNNTMHVGDVIWLKSRTAPALKLLVQMGRLPVKRSI